MKGRTGRARVVLKEGTTAGAAATGEMTAGAVVADVVVMTAEVAVAEEDNKMYDVRWMMYDIVSIENNNRIVKVVWSVN